MTPDDPRHGTYAGSNAHWGAGEELCGPCREAAATYARRRRKLRELYGASSIPSTGTRRRIQALMTLGWSGVQIGNASGIHRQYLWEVLAGERVTVKTAKRIARVYGPLSMTLPPETGKFERMAAARIRNLARRNGWAPPLAYDDIDRDPAPRGLRGGLRRGVGEYDGREIVDEVTVQRILDGDVVPANQAERIEAMRRWLALGNSQRSLCARMGWQEGRYKPREEPAA